jgi:alkanesulfonate monooxygenase SsuD/methylene tetrahydromethanopterin reductase-like flavin-dependent oxidoreductase (luciferase family)
VPELGLTVAPTRVKDLRRFAETADRTALSFVTVGDNPGNMLEQFVALTVAAGVTSRVGLGTAITNPTARHPLVVASAASAIAQLAPGRVFLCLGTGRSSMHVATLGGLREYVVALKELWGKGETVFRGERVTLAWPAEPVPVLIAAAQPKALRLAGELGDGVIAETGVTSEGIERGREAIAAGARISGREIDELAVWWYVRGSLAASEEEALDQALGPMAAAGLELGRNPGAQGVPPELHDAFLRIRERYDVSAHTRADAGSPNRALVADPQVQAYLLDRFGLVGTPERWVERLRELHARGAERIFCAAVVPDPVALADSVGRDVLPLV